MLSGMTAMNPLSYLLIISSLCFCACSSEPDPPRLTEVWEVVQRANKGGIAYQVRLYSDCTYLTMKCPFGARPVCSHFRNEKGSWNRTGQHTSLLPGILLSNLSKGNELMEVSQKYGSPLGPLGLAREYSLWNHSVSCRKLSETR